MFLYFFFSLVFLAVINAQWDSAQHEYQWKLCTRYCDHSYSTHLLSSPLLSSPVGCWLCWSGCTVSRFSLSWTWCCHWSWIIKGVWEVRVKWRAKESPEEHDRPSLHRSKINNNNNNNKIVYFICEPLTVFNGTTCACANIYCPCYTLCCTHYNYMYIFPLSLFLSLSLSLSLLFCIHLDTNIGVGPVWLW